MKKIIAIVVVIVALLMGAFFYWIHQPALVGEEQVTQSVNDANKRFAQTQREAKSAELNGFLSEEFLPVWSGQEGEVKQTLTTWSAYSNALRGNEVNHSALLDDANYRAARDGYEAVLPSLLTELDKRLFVVPRESLSSSQAPDANGLRTLSHSVYAYVESKVAEGKPEEAVRPLAALFSLGGKMQGRETLGNDLAGIAIQRIAFQAVALIPSDSKLAAQDWLSLATAVNQGIPPKDQMARAFEAEVSVSLEQIQKNENEAAASGSSLDQLFLQRENAFL